MNLRSVRRRRIDRRKSKDEYDIGAREETEAEMNIEMGEEE